MKKIITLGLVSALSTFLLVGCGGSTPGAHTDESGTAHTGSFHKNITQEKLSKLIKKACEKDGWNMTEFKSNAFVAEKTDGEDTISATVTFDKHSFDVNPENSDLEDIINDVVGN